MANDLAGLLIDSRLLAADPRGEDRRHRLEKSRLGRAEGGIRGPPREDVELGARASEHDRAFAHAQKRAGKLSRLRLVGQYVEHVEVGPRMPIVAAGVRTPYARELTFATQPVTARIAPRCSAKLERSSSAPRAVHASTRNVVAGRSATSPPSASTRCASPLRAVSIVSPAPTVSPVRASRRSPTAPVTVTAPATSAMRPAGAAGWAAAVQATSATAHADAM